MNRLLLFISLLAQTGFAQNIKVLTLDVCIDKAMTANADVITATNNSLYASYAEKNAWTSVLPELSASWNMNKIYGTAFDNVSFQRIQKATTTSFPSLDASVTLFNGFAGHAYQKETRELKLAAEADLAFKRQEILLSVGQTFFDCLTKIKTLRLYESRVNALTTLVRSTTIQVENSDRSMTDLHLVQAQLETEKALYYESYAAYKTTINNLLTIMGEQSSDSVSLQEFIPDPVSAATNSDSLYRLAIDKNFSLQSALHTLEAGKFHRKGAYRGFLPSITLGGSLASSYSSNGIFDFDKGIVLYPNYTEQMNLNFYQIIGLTVRVPIFTGMQNYYSIKQENIQVENKKLVYEKQKLKLYNDISSCVNDKQANVRKQLAYEQSVIASTEAWKSAEIQYHQGHGTFYDLLNTLNKKNQSELEWWQSKVDAWLIAKRLQLLTGEITN